MWWMVAIYCFTCTVLTGFVAESKKRSPLVWFSTGLALSIMGLVGGAPPALAAAFATVGLLAVGFMPALSAKNNRWPYGPKTRKCPHCAEEVLAEATKCKHCHSPL